MLSTQSDLPTVFAALADPTRIAIVERLVREGDRTAGELAEPFSISKPAISRHLAVLEKAGLIERKVDRQWRRISLKPEALNAMADWIETQRKFWTASFDRLERLIAQQEEEFEMTAATKTDDRVLEIERHIKAAPDKVFDAWTKPALLVKWWGPDGFDVPEHSLDVKKGGKWRTVMRAPDGKTHIVGGVYKLIDRPNRLEFTWAWEQEDGKPGHETVVTITFEADKGGTRMRLLQKTFQDKTGRDNHNMGWSSSFDCLDRLFSKKAAA